MVEGNHHLRSTLALAVRAPLAGDFAVSFSPDVGPDHITGMLPLIEESFTEAGNQALDSQAIRFFGRKRQLHCLRRADGAILSVLVDSAGAEAARAAITALGAAFERCTDTRLASISVRAGD